MREIAGRSPPERVGTPAWVLYQVGTENRYQRVLALELEGELDSAWALVRQLARDNPASIEIRGRLGALAARRRDRVLTLLETLPFRAHPVDVVFLHSDPAFASLRDDPRWIRMLKPKG
ncbi:MAG: hypothetical protein ACT4P6_15235 [Gemmatimonadaceae bacterium]